MALNGWIANYDKLEEFVVSKEQFYLRRHVVIWEDLIKINYVKNKSDSRVWERMNSYCEQMASVFDGFRLDNFHNSFIPAARHFLTNSYKVQEDLFVISEFFSPDKRMKAELI